MSVQVQHFDLSQRNVSVSYLIHGLAKHLPHKLKELQVVLVDVGGGRRIEPFVPASGLWDMCMKH